MPWRVSRNRPRAQALDRRLANPPGLVEPQTPGVRSPGERLDSACTIVEGAPPQTAAWMGAVDDCDAVITLAGENIFHRRWNEEFKALIRDSRVKGTDHVVQALAKNPRTASGDPKVLVNASAIGIYGPHGDEEISEESPPGNDVLARLCVDWEQAAQAAEPLGVRVAMIRTGLVLDK